MSRILGTEVSQKTLRWALGVGVFVILGLGMVLLFLLTQATQRWDLYEQNYTTLFVLNAVVAAFLLGVILWIIVRLTLRWRAGKFGSRLLAKLAFIFVVVGFIPGLLIYGVSYQFVSRSIEAWFDVKVEGALDAGLNLGRATLDALATDLGNKTKTAAMHLSESSYSGSAGASRTPKNVARADAWPRTGAPSKDEPKTSYALEAKGGSLGLDGMGTKRSSALEAQELDHEAQAQAQAKEGPDARAHKGVGGNAGNPMGLNHGVTTGLPTNTAQVLGSKRALKDALGSEQHPAEPYPAEQQTPEDQARSSSARTFSGAALERLREQLGAEELVVWSSDMTPLATAGGERYQLSPERPSPSQWRQLKSQSVLTVIEGLEDAPAHPEVKPQIKALALVAPSGLHWGLNGVMEPEVLQVTQRLPQALVANALALQAANLEYQERSLAREGLARMYIGTLTLSLFLSVFGAVLLAVLLGNQLARPLLWLVRGVRDVAAGDLSPRPVLTGADELDGLTRSFSQMTTQLLEARQTVEQSLEQVNLARSNLQTILDHLTAGVMVLDRQGVVLSTNPGATQILKIPMAVFVGKALKDIEGLEVFASQVLAQFEGFELERGQGGQDYWQQSFEIQSLQASSSPSDGSPPHGEHAFEDYKKKGLTNIIARGASLPNNSWLLVFDDISEIVSAERAQAWGEVARRLAHEIKNPLTPIQLSAERLQMKLTGKLQASEENVLNKSVKMIVDQVDAMKRLVNEFRDYARLPQAQLQSTDLNALVSEVVQLYGAHVEELGALRRVGAQETNQGMNQDQPQELSQALSQKPSQETLAPTHSTVARGVTLEAHLDPLCPPIQADPLQLRQVVHNLIQNAQDATEGLSDAKVRVVRVYTQFNAASSRVRLRVEDSGGGFPDFILKRAFEPYVTTKSKGTGLGLAVVKKIADEHGARISLSNLEADGAIIGAQVTLSFAVAQSQQNVV